METRVAQENGGRVCRDWESGWIYRQPTWTSSSLLGLWKSREPLPLLEAGAQQVGGWGTEDSMGVLRQWENRKDWGGQPAWTSPSLQGPQESRESAQLCGHEEGRIWGYSGQRPREQGSLVGTQPTWASPSLGFVLFCFFNVDLSLRKEFEWKLSFLHFSEFSTSCLSKCKLATFCRICLTGYQSISWLWMPVELELAKLLRLLHVALSTSRE